MRNQFDHYEAIEQRYFHEKSYLAAAKTGRERKWREHNIAMIERELEGEIDFLEKRGIDCSLLKQTAELTDEELLSELLQ